MPTIPDCELFAKETRAVQGIGHFPRAHGDQLAMAVARALAMADAAQKFPAESQRAAVQLANEYQCSHPHCPNPSVWTEASGDFKWVKRLETFRAGQAIAFWFLEMEFYINCEPDPQEGPPPPEHGEGSRHEAPQYGYFDKKLNWIPFEPNVEKILGWPDLKGGRKKTKA